MKHKLLTLASAALLFAACSDTSVSDANDEIKEKGTVTFFVYDALTRQPIEKADIYYRTSGKTNKTDAKGGFVWKGVDIGTSYFDITHEGYADIRHTTYLDDQIQHDVARVDDNTEKIPMFELGVNVKGKLYYIDHETKDWMPAAGVTVYVDYPDSSEIFPNEVYTTTEEDGSYKFENLAANVMFQVKSERFTVNDSIVYEVTSIDSVSQRKGVKEHTWKELDPVAADVASLEPVLLSSNLSNVGVKDDIKLTFSEELEKDSVTTSHIKVFRVTGDAKDPITQKPTAVSPVAISVSLDNNVVTIKSKSGEWADGKSYIVEFDVWSKLAKELKDSVKIAGVEYKYYRKFTAGSLAVPGKVKNLKVKLDDDDNEEIYQDYEGEYTYDSELDNKSDLAYTESITLQWDALEKGVDVYNIYIKGDKDNDADYIWVADVEATKPDVEEKTIDLAKALNKGKFLLYPQNKFQSGVVTFIVLAKNAAGEALASEAEKLEIKTFDKAKSDVNEKLENKTLKKAEVKVSKLWECTAESDKDCTAEIEKGTTTPDFSGPFYRADLSIEGTIESDYDGEYPDKYALYISTGKNTWKKIAEQDATVGYAPVFTLSKDDPESPFDGVNFEYKSNVSNTFTFAIVPVFHSDATSAIPGWCSVYVVPDTEEECDAAGGVWTPEVPAKKGYTISPTTLDGKNGTVYVADDDINAIVKTWDD